MDSLIRGTKSGQKSWRKPDLLGVELQEHIDVDCLPKVFAEMCRAVSASLAVSTDMVAASMLGVLSVCVNRHWIIARDGWEQPLALYMMGIGEPGEKKSPVLRKLLAPVNDWETQTNNNLDPKIIESEQKRKNLESLHRKAQRDFEKGKVDEKETFRLAKELAEYQQIKPVKVYTTDSTMEKLPGLLQDNDEHFSVVSDESTILKVVSGIYQNGVVNADVLLKMFNGEPVRIDRKTSGSIYLEHPVLSMLLFCQPVILTKLIGNDELRHNGFVERVLFFKPESSIGKGRSTDPIIPPQIMTRYSNEIKRLLNIESNIYLRFSPEAQRSFDIFADGFNSDIRLNYEGMTGWASKHPGIVARFAGILQLAEDGKAIITDDTIQNAIIIADYFQQQARAILRPEGLNPIEHLASYLLDRIILLKKNTFINEAGDITLNYVTLQNNVHKKGLGRKKEDFAEPLQVLIDRGYIDVDSDDVSKLNEIYINPAVWG